MSTLGETPTRAQALTAQASEAAEVRAALSDPNVKALQIEHSRKIFNRLVWLSVVFCLGFTATTVQQFAAHGAPVGSFRWWSAWLLDPGVTVALVAALIAEQEISTWGVTVAKAANRVKWICLGLTYAMNCWTSWAHLDWYSILLHSAPVFVAFVLVHEAPKLRDGITKAVQAAAGPVETGRSGPDHEEEPTETLTAPLPDPLPAVESVRPTDLDLTASDWSGLEDLQAVARSIAPTLDRISRASVIKALRNHDSNLTVSTDRAGRLAKVLNAERDQCPAPLHSVEDVS